MTRSVPVGGGKFDPTVRCGDCGWQGPISQLLNANGLRHCPQCGREFTPFPSHAPDQGA